MIIGKGVSDDSGKSVESGDSSECYINISIRVYLRHMNTLIFIKISETLCSG